ncbi:MULTISPECIES: RNA polymerase sigma factor [Sorangium]|nr:MULTISPECIES: RNA polymerase sigma factor [Sorangium]
MAEQGRIRAMLRSLGVHPQDREDLAQEVLFAAWRAIEACRYMPDPARDASYALRAWLMGIAWRKASHYHGRAHRRRELPVGLDPWYLAVPEPVVDRDPVDRLDALEGILSVFRLPHRQKEVLLLASIGHGPTEIAGIVGVPIGTAASRLRRGRQLLAESLTGGKR